MDSIERVHRINARKEGKSFTCKDCPYVVDRPYRLKTHQKKSVLKRKLLVLSAHSVKYVQLKKSPFSSPGVADYTASVSLPIK